MSSLSTQNTGDIILADHHNQIHNLLKGVAGSGETITLVYNAAGVITLTPSSNPAASTELIIVNNAAGTRQFAITAGGDLVGTGGILTLPAGADTLVGRATTDTLTNKTLTAPTIADFTNAAHDHGDADDGGALAAHGIALHAARTGDHGHAHEQDAHGPDDRGLHQRGPRPRGCGRRGGACRTRHRASRRPHE